MSRTKTELVRIMPASAPVVFVLFCSAGSGEGHGNARLFELGFGLIIERTTIVQYKAAAACDVFQTGDHKLIGVDFHIAIEGHRVRAAAEVEGQGVTGFEFRCRSEKIGFAKFTSRQR